MNDAIRADIRSAGFYQWQVAQALGVTEMTLIRWLRNPLDSEKEQKIKNAILKLKGEN